MMYPLQAADSASVTASPKFTQPARRSPRLNKEPSVKSVNNAFDFGDKEDKNLVTSSAKRSGSPSADVSVSVL